jgi:hypothetical protein
MSYGLTYQCGAADMRDASFEDMTAMWIARVVERADWTPTNEVYLALIRHAASKYIEKNSNTDFGAMAFAELDKLLNDIQAGLPKSPDGEQWLLEGESWMLPNGIMWSQLSPEKFEQRYAYYWTTNMWRSDFRQTLESQFWTYKDYAHAAGNSKMAFLRELAEVWIAAATSALVRYADNDPRTWRATAKMLRRHADMVEADGLRALPWGSWGAYAPPEAQSKDAVETSDG